MADRDCKPETKGWKPFPQSGWEDKSVGLREITRKWSTRSHWKIQWTKTCKKETQKCWMCKEKERPGKGDNDVLVGVKAWWPFHLHSHRCLRLLSCFSTHQRRDAAAGRRFGVFISHRRYLCSLSKLFLQKKGGRPEWYHLLWLPTAVWSIGPGPTYWSSVQSRTPVWLYLTASTEYHPLRVLTGLTDPVGINWDSVRE